ncbi:short-subunit dehydrogenase [Motilibacter rhizosphaerae]|uniref:Short-subunit dehydrogenase n=1 Tax=Motilibacter rhizosphaerae TaxID=598652 RepID=A0A4Q7NV57_9ACTN|nr:SDR family oxidoreductase [Motilibacter rhizosphaerae]RZS90994.1 short-subunit dehydrogenase [Motilibacter rhizosphaerae]
MAAQVVVVSGASGGVGRAVARAYASRGAKVGLLARGEKGLAGAADDVRRCGGTPLEVPTDVADYEAVERAAQRVEDELGPIDVWVNVAFSSVFAPFAETSIEEFTRATQVTYLGVVHGTKAALDRMLPRDSGVVVQVGSALAYRGIPLQSAYCGAKHAIQGFHDSVRSELLHDGTRVRVTMVQLPAVNTPQFDWVLSKLPHHPQPVPPIYQPEVAAEAIVWAAEHPERREYYVGSSAVATIFGDKLLPGLLDRYLGRTGWTSQQTGEPARPDRPANLWEPADGPEGEDFGAHGSFDDQAKPRSLQWELQRGPWAVAAVVNLASAAYAGAKMVATGRKDFAHVVLDGLGLGRRSDPARESEAQAGALLHRVEG